MSTFLGVPGIGNLRGDEPFPAAARRGLADEQMRRNLGRATKTIRTKRIAAVGECADWEELRAAGSALKRGWGVMDSVMANILRFCGDYGAF